MPTAYVEVDPPSAEAPGLGGPSADLVYFLSLAYSARFGASHELALAANVLRNDLGIDLRPLLTFADRTVEEEMDAQALDHAWQDPAPLARCCEAVVAALDAGDERLKDARRDYPTLRERVAEVGSAARWASEHGRRVRITYELDSEP